jgi:2-keto-4-pentenoate hydratase/2-oxohepta-3-ene-1,7-dioic acid hydratase in catechol pathway
MKLVRFLDDQGKDGVGLVEDGAIVPLSPEGERIDGVMPTRLLSPIEPAQIIGIGLNYRQHAEETKAEIPKHPIVFYKNLASVQDPGQPIRLPRHAHTDKVDFECELAVVIGKTCKHVRHEEALDYVLGYTCANDVSARDWQKDAGGGQWCRGKSFDTFCPLGPYLVTADEIPNPNALRIKTTLNGEVMQDWTTGDMIFDVPALIAYLSASMTLPAGTVILTGTPQGVGMARDPRVWLKHGDVVAVEIEGIGILENPVELEAWDGDSFGV